MTGKVPSILFIFIFFTSFLISNIAIGNEQEPAVTMDMENALFYIGPIAPEDLLSFNQWKPVAEFEKKLLTGHHDMWLRLELPDADWNDPALLLTAYLNEISIYKNNSLIYIYSPAMHPAPGDFKYYTSHVVPIPAYTPGTVIFLHTYYPSWVGVGEIISISLGDISQMMGMMMSEREALYQENLIDLCLGFLLLVIGTASFFIFIIRFREFDYPFLGFGTFSFFVGLTYLSELTILFPSTLSPETQYYVKSFSFLMVPAGLFSFFHAMFKLGKYPSRIVSAMWIFHACLAIIAMFLTGFGIDYALFFLTLLTFNCILSIIFILNAKQAAPFYIKTIFICFFLLFIILILFHFLERFNLIPFSYDFFGLGMVLFVFGLGYILIKHYTQTYTAMERVSFELEKKKSEFLELQKENLTSQLEALKNQVNPHFLFNSFSTLASIIEESRNTALNFVQELSKVYRYVLQTRVATMVTLKEELDFIESYKFLMINRFGENLRMTINIPDPYRSFLIMPFALQLLVENAIKHNIISKKHPLAIHVFLENSYLVVTNTLQKKATSGKSTHIGLANIQNRYRLISEKEVRIKQHASEFRVEIPLIENKGKDNEHIDY